MSAHAQPRKAGTRPALCDEGTPLVARLGAIGWPSFFAAGFASMVFFAIVDPAELAAITWPHVAITREAGYTIGFFMFWACTIASSLFTSLLLPVPGQGSDAPSRAS